MHLKCSPQVEMCITQCVSLIPEQGMNNNNNLNHTSNNGIKVEYR